ncbi:MAG: FAD binding domain-containing protein [Bryobacteraceae bacterium]|nr:FAD binding domain-containing protein [Bryobacteraceae bacterium]
MNGRPVAVDGYAPQTTLLDYLRDRGLTGAKEGCAEGECGACTVLLVAKHGDQSAYRAVNSCLMFLPMAAGQEIYTVESLVDKGELCEAQAALAAAGGSQCGYCTPGFVMSLFAEQYRPGREGACDPHQMGGNLCRCTGYRPIRDAALSLGPAPAGVFLDRLAWPAPTLTAVEQTGFSRPVSVEECVRQLAVHPGAKLVAGGTDLGVESNLLGRRWPHLISLEAIPELQRFDETADAVIIGAALPLTDVLDRWTSAPAALADCLLPFASPTIRNRATLGGNLGNASPIGDSAPLLLALDAAVYTSARRRIPLADFFTGYRQTALAAGEFLTAIEVPKPYPAFLRFYKVSKRRMDDISTLSAAFAWRWDGERVADARLAFGGVAARPLRVCEAEEALAGEPWTLETIARVQAVLAQTLQPLSDHRGSAAYRTAVAQSLLEKAFYG